jgi:hypothetical protein
MGIKLKVLINWPLFIVHKFSLPCSQEPGSGHCPLSNPVHTFQYYPLTTRRHFKLFLRFRVSFRENFVNISEFWGEIIPRFHQNH